MTANRGRNRTKMMVFCNNFDKTRGTKISFTVFATIELVSSGRNCQEPKLISKNLISKIRIMTQIKFLFKQLEVAKKLPLYYTRSSNIFLQIWWHNSLHYTVRNWVSRIFTSLMCCAYMYMYICIYIYLIKGGP